MSQKNESKESKTATPNPPNGWLTKAAAANYLGITKHRMHKILKEGRIPESAESAKIQTVKRGKGTLKRWIISKAALDKYAQSKGRNTDGKVYAEARMTAEEMATLNKLAKDAGLEISIVPHYVRVKQAAAKKAAKK